MNELVKQIHDEIEVLADDIAKIGHGQIVIEIKHSKVAFTTCLFTKTPKKQANLFDKRVA